MAIRAVYPGSFDPPTMGHLDITQRAAALFDELVIAVYDAPISKKLMFSTEERVDLFERSAKAMGIHNIRVEPYTGLTVKLAADLDAGVLIRGIRAFEDFVYESDMALMNRKMAPELEVVFLMTRLEYSFVSSSRVKEIASLGAEYHEFVPPIVASALKDRLAELR